MASIGLVDRKLYVRGIGNNFVYDYIQRGGLRMVKVGGTDYQ